MFNWPPWLTTRVTTHEHSDVRARWRGRCRELGSTEEEHCERRGPVYKGTEQVTVLRAQIQ